MLLLILLATATVNLIVYFRTHSLIRSEEELAGSDFDADLIIVLGAGLRQDGTPSDMLADRVTVGVGLYNRGVGARVLMSGDRSSDSYDEPRAMTAFATETLSMDEEAILVDGEGYSTYESLSRVREQYGEGLKIVIVTQEYHLYRSLDIAEKLGFDARGVSADLRSYRGQIRWETREILARVKDFFVVRLKK